MKQLLKFLWDTVGTIAIAVVLAFLIAQFVAQVTIVQGASMNPTLETKQRVIVDKLTYRFSEPQPSDIVLVKLPDPEPILIKRVIAVAGQTVAVRDSTLYIDGMVVDEPYIVQPQNRDVAEVTVGEDEVYVMGDNRNNSRDSRMFGAVPVDDITGIARVSIWPLSTLGTVE